MRPFSLNLRQRLVSYDRPAVMGIININDDSFYAPSRVNDADALRSRVRQMIAEGADIIDLGACSTRPGSLPPDVETEWERLAPAIECIREIAPDVPLSVDTYRASVAARAVEAGVDIINDISGGSIDCEMFDTVAQLQVPYILMHMRGTPANMNEHCHYDDVTAEVLSELSHCLYQLALRGVNDIIVDPGFGFSKTLLQNYRLLDQLETFKMLERPILVGVSRKSMISSLSPDDTLIGTSVVNTLALDRGADILRVHDVAAARRVIDLYSTTVSSYQ